MAQYKSFASKGSFSDFQLNVPDEAQKILDRAEKQVAGMRTAQRQTEANQDLLLQDTKNYRNIQEQVRKTNYDLKSKEGELYRQALDRDYKTDIANLERQSKAKEQEELYSVLSAFSESAGKVFQSFIEDRKKKDRANKNYVAMVGGINYQDLQNITKIDRNLSRSEFNQLDFIQQEIASGASPERINALFHVHENSGSKAWMESKAVLQNSALGFTPALEEKLRELPTDASYDQINQTIEAVQAEFFETAFAGARPEVLEASGVYANLRKQADTFRNGYYKLSTQAAKDKVKSQQFQAFNVLKSEGGLGAVHAESTVNPSAEKRKLVFEWLSNSLSSGNVTYTEAQDFLSKMTFKMNGKDVTYAEQFNGFAEVSDLQSAVNSARAREHQQFALSVKETNQRVESEIIERGNQIINEKGNISAADLKALEEIEAEGEPGYQSRALQELRGMSDEVRASEAIDAQWTDRLSKRGIPPSLDEINSLPLNPQVKNKWINITNNYNALKPKYKEHHKAIKDQIKSHPQIRALGQGAAPGSVAVMQQRMVQEFDVLAVRLGDPDQAAAIILEKVQKIQANPNAIDPNGNYVSIMNELKTDAKRAEVTLNQLNDSINVILKGPTIDYKTLAASMGAANVYSGLEALKTGKRPSAVVSFVASRLNTSPVELLNKIAVETGNKDKVVKFDTPWQKIVENLPPIKRRLLNVYKTPERNKRAMTSVTGTTGIATRGSFNLSDEVGRLRSAIIGKESGGSYTVVNPDSGAIGAGQVMPENVGPWTQRYLGRALTPEEFRYNSAAQDAVLNGRFKDMLADQRAAGFSGEQMVRRAAAVWYSGQADLWNYNKPEYYNGRRYPSIAEYTQDIWKRFQNN